MYACVVSWIFVTGDAINAAKKTSQKKNGGTRESVQTPETLKEWLKDIEAGTESVRRQIALMEASSVAKVTVAQGHAEATRAVTAIANYAHYIDQALRKERQKRGDFGTPA